MRFATSARPDPLINEEILIMSEPILRSVDTRGVATLTLNRPECHNALNRQSASQLITHLNALEQDQDVRLVVLTGQGISFSAGHDIIAMRAMLQASEADLRAELTEYTTLLATLDNLAKPTLAKVQGSAFGLGVGMIACCDFAIAVSDALFGFSDVRQGVISAVPAPYVVRAIGHRAARRYLIGSERFNASKAKRLGLLHQDVAPALLGSAMEQLIRQILTNGPAAMAATKQMVKEISSQPLDAGLISNLIQRSIEIRHSPEGREGIDAFIEHRTPDWFT